MSVVDVRGTVDLNVVNLAPWLQPAAVDALVVALRACLPQARRVALLGAAAGDWAVRLGDEVVIETGAERADVVVVSAPDALPPAAEDEPRFVEALVQRADAVLLATVNPAGAVDRPGRWPAYWAERFAPHGYRLVDAIRAGIWHDSYIGVDVKEGTLLFVGPDVVLEREPGPPSAVLHPQRQTETLRTFEARVERLRAELDERDRAAAAERAGELDGQRLLVRALEARLAAVDRRVGFLADRSVGGSTANGGAADAARAVVGRLARRPAVTARAEATQPGPDRAVAALFDPLYYAEHNPEAAAAPLQHYLQEGEAQGRRPNAWFDPTFYRAHNPDVVAAGMGALEHYAQYGGAEGRPASAEFHTAWYVAQHPEVVVSGLHPLLHFLAIGEQAGYQPNPDAPGALQAATLAGSVYAPSLAALAARSAPPPDRSVEAEEEATVSPTSSPAAGQAQRQPLCGTYVGNGRVLVYLQTGGRLLVSSDDLTLVSELVQDGIYDVPFTRFLQRTLRPESVFVDVGANVGLFSIVAGYLAWEGRTIAYEAAPMLASLLADNVAANWFADRVVVRPVAVGAAAGTATFGFPTTMHTLGGLHLDTTTFNELYPGVIIEQVPVTVVSLDDDLAALGVDGPIDLIKVDVEGGEADVLRGMRSLLSAGRVRRLSLEVRRDAHERNRGSESWPDMAGELRRLAELGGRFGAPDLEGALQPLELDEVLATALYANLVVSFDV